MSWEEPGHGDRPVERLAAVMPCADAVVTTEIATDVPQREPYGTSAGPGCSPMWSAAGAPERVGGTRHARPAVPPALIAIPGQRGSPRDRLGASRRVGRTGRCGPGTYSTAGGRPRGCG